MTSHKFWPWLPGLSNHACDGDDVFCSTPVQVKEPGWVILAAQSTRELRQVLLYLLFNIYICDGVKILKKFLEFSKFNIAIIASALLFQFYFEIHVGDLNQACFKPDPVSYHFHEPYILVTRAK